MLLSYYFWIQILTNFILKLVQARLHASCLTLILTILHTFPFITEKRQIQKIICLNKLGIKSNNCRFHFWFIDKEKNDWKEKVTKFDQLILEYCKMFNAVLFWFWQIIYSNFLISDRCQSLQAVVRLQRLVSTRKLMYTVVNKVLNSGWSFNIRS